MCTIFDKSPGELSYSGFSCLFLICYLIAASAKQWFGNCWESIFKILIVYTSKNEGLLKKEDSNTAMNHYLLVFVDFTTTIQLNKNHSSTVLRLIVNDAMKSIFLFHKCKDCLIILKITVNLPKIAE